ncbi:MAG: ATP-dependent sacrificial sulfur transferase LarE [Fibromonadaceae bacterium]|nr:ATP-dependent sacrificial sulfur transferase LarE [Fibromonadaceae bacterium]
MLVSLESFFKENPLVALGFSGGVDSSYLLYAGLSYGAKVKAYFVKTEFQPESEFKDAQRLAKHVGAELVVLEKSILAYEKVISNPPDRCYHCKRIIFGAIQTQALADGIPFVIDGTNASDNIAGRPGVKALKELSVRSPLWECGITKDEIRRLSKEAGLFTWDKSAFPCLAIRVPFNTVITKELLEAGLSASHFA